MIYEFIKRWKHEFIRIALTFLIITICFYPDWAALQTTMFIAGVFFAIALISHLVRKYALFPYIDLRRYSAKALEEPLAAAVVFASVCAVIVVSISTAATFFAR